MGNIIGMIIMGLLAILCFVFSYLQFHEKGFLFNNAYIYASKKEREKMDKRPHYKQSGVIFLLLGIIWLINAVDMVLKTEWLFYLFIVVVVITVIYAIISSIFIEKRKKYRR